VETALRQTRALTTLLFRFWRRGPLPTARPKSAGRRASGFVLRLVFVLLFARIGHQSGSLCAGMKGAQAVLAVEWLVLALAGLSSSFGFLSQGPTARGIVNPLHAPILDALPLMEASRVIVMVFQNVAMHALAIAAVQGAAPHLGVVHALSVGFAMSTTGLLLGSAAMRLLRTVISPLRLARVSAIFLGALYLPSFMVFVAAPLLASWQAVAFLVRPVRPFALAVLQPSHTPAAMIGLLALIALASLGIGLAERIGYDRVDALPTKRLQAAASEQLTLARVERVLLSREPARRAAIVMFVETTLVTAGIGFLAFRSPGALKEGGSLLLRMAVGFATFLAFTSASTRAARLAERDVVARPLLAPLPVAPSDLLQGKASAIRRQTLLVAAPLVAMLAFPGSLTWHIEVAWRMATMLIGLWLMAGAVVSIAFLTAGLGGGTRPGMGTGFGLEGILLFIPLASVALAPYVWSAVVSLGCVALLSIEARRAALGCVRWLDDGENFDRETPVWRALLVFTTFQAAQALAIQLLALSHLGPQTSLAVAYSSSATVLVALTFYERRGLPPLAYRPERWSFLPLGVACGALSGFLALGYSRALRHFAIGEPPSNAHGAGLYLFAAAVVVAAPFAEETFFRGWLQDAIVRQYPTRGRLFALGITAFAFAAIHPPLAFVPVLVLGLLTGWLFASGGGIVAAIAAHALHNLLVTVLH
jgi:membrane protease YdiL (CAAX protease family)